MRWKQAARGEEGDVGSAVESSGSELGEGESPLVEDSSGRSGTWTVRTWQDVAPDEPIDQEMERALS
jgi:hypothetical protein